MTKFDLPVLLPPGVEATVTQPFGVTANELEPIGPNGEAHFHYGVDLVFGTPAETYGTPIVMPFVDGRIAGYLLPPSTYSDTPFVSVSGVGATGNRYLVVFDHIANFFMQDAYAHLSILGTVGNYGTVSPVPTPENPFGGSHLHLGLMCDDIWVDPLEYFDIKSPHIGGPHDPANDVPRLVWALAQLSAEFAALKSSPQQ